MQSARLPKLRGAPPEMAAGRLQLSSKSCDGWTNVPAFFPSRSRLYVQSPPADLDAAAFRVGGDLTLRKSGKIGVPGERRVRWHRDCLARCLGE